jgi:hypothetical protein
MNKLTKLQMMRLLKFMGKDILILLKECGVKEFQNQKCLSMLIPTT